MKTSEEKRAYARQYYLDHKDEILAYRKSIPLSDDHLEKMKVRSKKYYQDHKEELRNKHREYHETHREEIEENRLLHRDERLAKDKEVRKMIRKNIITHYGGKCACCGEIRMEFLALDHINGGGVQHRKSLGIKGGTKFYEWIWKNNFPDGFRILCHNCNVSLGIYGYCPHQKEMENA